MSQANCFQSFSAYQVIVLKVVDGVEKLPENYDSQLKAASDAKKNDVNFYIAAEIKNVPVLKKPWKFTVGDGKKTKIYVNEELEKGQDYIVYERALTDTTKVCKSIILLMFPHILKLESSDHSCDTKRFVSSSCKISQPLF